MTHVFMQIYQTLAPQKGKSDSCYAYVNRASCIALKVSMLLLGLGALVPGASGGWG